MVSINSNIVSSANSQQPLSTANSDKLTSATLTNHIVAITNDKPAVYAADPFSQGFYADDVSKLLMTI